MSGHRSFHVLEALEASPARTRRVWSRAAKERILAEANVPSINVSAVARAHGVNVAQLFRWRRDAGSFEQLRVPTAKTEATGPSLSFIEMTPITQTKVASHSAAEICEIDVAGVVLRVGPSVSAQRVVELIRAARLA